jgi:hypothetical protein
MDQQAQISDPQVDRRSTNEFASLSLARAYIDITREKIGAFGNCGMKDALERLDRAYRQFPELMADRPRGKLVEDLRSAAENLPDRTAISLLMYCVASCPSCSSAAALLFEKIAKADGWASLFPVLHLLCRSQDLPWPAIKPIAEALRQQGRTDTILRVISEVLDSVIFATDDMADDLGEILTYLLSDEHRLGIDRRALAEAARSARRRLRQPSLARSEPRSREALLAMAERLGATPSPQRSNPRPGLRWPSGRMSFDEFLLQWPCEVELPGELDDAALIEEAFRTILLREPDVAERDQYLRLLQDGVVSRPWIIEDLLATEELRSLERGLRVNWGGQVITKAESSGEEDMPVVTWPWQPASR